MCEPNATSGQISAPMATIDPEEAAAVARRAAFARIPLWAYSLPLRPRERDVLGRIYSFQCTGHVYSMSHQSLADELGCDRARVKDALRRLLDLGYLAKQANGRCCPAHYYVDEAACVTAAMANGWVPRG